jgi:anti-sigma factor RsiW
MIGRKASLEASPMRRNSRPRLATVMATLLAPSLLAVGCAGATGGRSGAGSALHDEIARNHPVYSRETKHLVEVPADEVEHLKMWLGDRLGGAFNVPELGDFGLRFQGGRMLVLDGRPVAQLFYTRDAGPPVGLYIAAATEPGSAPVSVEERRPLSIGSWRDGSYDYALVGEMSGARVRDIAERAASEVRN